MTDLSSLVAVAEELGLGEWAKHVPEGPGRGEGFGVFPPGHSYFVARRYMVLAVFDIGHEVRIDRSVDAFVDPDHYVPLPEIEAALRAWAEGREA